MSGTQRALIGAGIKSIQRGVITIAGSTGSNTATITAVTTAKSELRLLGSTTATSGGISPNNDFVKLVLTNTTTVTASRQNAAAPSAIDVSWEVTESY